MEDNETGDTNNSNQGNESPVKVTRFRNLPSVNNSSSEDLHAIITNNEDSHLLSSVRRRVQISSGKVQTGSLNVLSAKYESLDYDTSVDMYVAQGKLYIPYGLWVLYNVVPVFIGSMLVAFVEPIAAGSGIPQVKCYLNGVKIPRVVRIKTLFVKSVGVVCSVVGGLAGGKARIQLNRGRTYDTLGAVVAAGISQGKSSTFGKDFNIFRYFREDHEKRDFVSGGAAAGVSAAFGAPVGKEKQNKWGPIQSGRRHKFLEPRFNLANFFASVISTFTLNIVLSTYHGVPGNLSYPGLLNLGQFETFGYEIYELPIFVIMGAVGGLFGALWNHINYKITVFRMRHVRPRWLKVFEACIVAAVSATLGFLMMFLINDCKPLGQDPTRYPTQLYCSDGQYNVLASIWFQTPEASVRSLFHDPPNTHNATSLAVFVVVYFLLAAWTFGLSSSNGLFIPTLLTGAAWGRLVSIGMCYVFPETLDHPGKYALIGAAAQLGGVVRMTISLTVIIMETTGNITFALPLILTLIAAKWTGDFFNEGIYDTLIQLSGVPLLPWEPPPLVHNIYASEVMSHPVVTLRCVENVGHIVELLRLTTYNGFPVVDPPLTDQNEVTTYGRIRGLILRSQLIVILKRKIYNETSDDWDSITASIFRNEYPRYPMIDEISINDEEKTYSVDLRPFMNPSPYTVLHSSSLPRMFKIFRGLGLRHLPIVNDTNEVIGMVTRKDLARYRVWRHQGRMGVEELLISKEI
ncbi:hypothetical protein NQ314_004939 [Rhamnusium bicolor]|uniref:Chloride channel protein n=1 Tax=Rhamnusium bicolor TaxID=1586634 RepID=A0AAV8ZJD0_9CUCU|nr:hypothetical protein NQ314_004939 [Rhamnusium bicolor]